MSRETPGGDVSPWKWPRAERCQGSSASLARERGRWQVLCRFSDAGMTGPSTRRGGRRPKSAKARNRGRERQRCRGHYGDLAAGSGAREWRRGGRQTCFAWLKERDLKRDRAVRVVGAAIVGFWVVIAQATGAATRTSALSAQSQRRCRARMEGSSSSAGIMRYRA
jgi:hypothetical protein